MVRLANLFDTFQVKRYGDTFYFYGNLVSTGADTLYIQWRIPKGTSVLIESVQGWHDNGSTKNFTILVLGSENPMEALATMTGGDVSGWKILSQDLSTSTATSLEIGTYTPNGIDLGPEQIFTCYLAVGAGSKTLRIYGSAKITEEKLESEF